MKILIWYCDIPRFVVFVFPSNRDESDPSIGMLPIFGVLIDSFPVLLILELLSEVLLYERMYISQITPSLFYLMKAFNIIYQEMKITLMARLFF